ncbi:MAG TPA: hypothetical protein VGR48_17835 [Terriglobales bacterium]|nr:hypothetical protein [Terriglobales bacterium]
MLLITVVALGQQRGEKEAVLSEMTKSFGSPVRVEPPLYGFGDAYTVAPVFSPGGAVERICVEPKDYGSSSYLYQSEYDELLRLLSLVKPLGGHKEDLGVEFMHGGRAWTQQRFENAYISVGRLVGSIGTERRIDAVCMYYLRPVAGIVHFRASAIPSSFGLICINNQAYIAPIEEQAKLRRSDEAQTVTVAGPTGDDCRNVASQNDER